MAYFYSKTPNPAILWVVIALLLTFCGPETVYSIEVNKGAIPQLIIKERSGNILTTGTGFIIKPEGVLITAYHLLVGAASVEAVFPNGMRTEVKGIYRLDRTKDFAILQLEGNFFSTLEVGDSTLLSPFDYVSALGYAFTGEKTGLNEPLTPVQQTYGMVLGTHPQAHPTFPLIYTTAALSPGFSGGPLLDQNNKVLGIGLIEGRSVNLSLPINHLKPIPTKGSLISFDKLKESDQRSQETLYYRGSIELYAQSNPEKALTLFEQTLAKDPQFVPALYDMAVAYQNMGDVEKAIDAYEKALKIHPRFPEALSNLSAQYFRFGKVQQALQSVKKAVEIFPNFIQALSNLGAIFNKLKLFEKALPHLKKTVQLSPEFAIAHYNLGNAYFGLNRFKEARAAFERSANLGLDFLSLHWKLFEIHQKKGRIQEAIRELTFILDIDPTDAKAQAKLRELNRSR